MDWTVRHENGAVRLITPTGHEVVLPLAEYSAAVCRFADKVAAYYAACSPKTEPQTISTAAAGSPSAASGPAAARLRLEVGQRPLVLACGPGYGEVCGNS